MKSDCRPADNPFRVQRHARVRYAVGPVLDAFVARFEGLGRRAALVGPHGTGKSTLREDLERYYASVGWTVVRLHFTTSGAASPQQWACWLTASPRTLATVDGVEQLPRWAWQVVRRVRRGPLLVTSHADCGLPVLHEHVTTATILRDCIEELAGPVDVDVDALFARHQGNVRAALLECYDRWAASGSFGRTTCGTAPSPLPREPTAPSRAP